MAAMIDALECEEFRIPSDDAGIDLFVRNKHASGMKEFGPNRTLLFVHGATYPASTSFDLALDGFSWMDFIAAQGFDVYALDLRGYGRSTRPPEMDRPAEDSQPIVRGDVALRDIAAAVRFIRERRQLNTLSLMGWSWGTTLVATYTSLNPQLVNRLVLYAPLWIRQPGPRTAALAGQRSPAYRTVTKAEAHDRWLAGVPEHARDTLIPEGWFDCWATTTWATDPKSQSTHPAELRAPNGVIQDVVEYYNVGRPYFDPARIEAPTLLVSPEWDNDTPPYMAHALFDRLPSRIENQLVSLPEGTHSMLMERNRLQLFTCVQSFLTSPGTQQIR
ncbi:alpha/beta fold hydrolase [Tardiphaga alba]|uniref:Alpha/beta fold hydrolase n=1 Tax=Tardiphaga alba TaxID=340268 RepID=A0ABX8ABR4_9BRAD|nr:alpha/beta fold hydrolase [Tardiphaga alba]QUS41004.1 alpha/beta fold hydrolase [Tardiphaga alba]